MGNINDCNCQPQLRTNQNSLSVLTKNLETYAMSNNLMQFDKKTRAIIETLFVLRQPHVSDRLMQLLRGPNFMQGNKMIEDLSRVNLEEYDQILHSSLAAEKKNKGVSKISYIDLVKVSSKYIEQGENCLQNKKFMFIIPINCFGQSKDIDLFKQTDLLSKKSSIQIFEQKLECLKQRYNSIYTVYIITPISEFQSIKQQCPPSFTVIPFAPNQPCFTPKNKIILNDDSSCNGNSCSSILFNCHDGDIVHFIFNNAVLKESIGQFEYIVFPDLGNYVSPAVNPAQIGLLNSRGNKRILAAIKNMNHTKISNINNNINEQGEKIKTDNNFVCPQGLQFGDIIIKTSILKQISTKTSQLIPILSQTIHREPFNLSSTPTTQQLSTNYANQQHLHDDNMLSSVSQSQIPSTVTPPVSPHSPSPSSSSSPSLFPSGLPYFLLRHPTDLLQQSLSLLVKVPFSATNIKQYSNFCKNVLGIQNQNENDFIHIDVGLLHARLEVIDQLRNSMRNGMDILYPVVVVKSHYDNN